LQCSCNIDHSSVECILPFGNRDDRPVLLSQLAGQLSDGIATIGYYQCGIGTYEPSDAFYNCTSCAPGFFSPITSATTCLPCESGLFSLGGASQCNQCNVGTHSDSSSASTSCLQCSVGFFAATSGLSSCTECDSGKYARTRGQGTCQSCASGSYQSISGQSYCDLCGVATYSSAPAQSTCQSCADGTYTSINGSNACVSCSIGKSAISGSSTCESCDLGTFAYTEGKSECTACPLGKFGNYSGATECYSCSSGTFAGSEGLTACEYCVPGTSNAQQGQSSCADCATGRYYASTGAIDCSDCSMTTYQATTGATACTLCEAGKYNPSQGQSTCLDCYSGSTSIIGSSECTSCIVGTSAAATTTSVLSSSIGSVCDPCLEGYFTSSTGQVTCQSCNVGSVNNNTGMDRCTSCPAGYFANSEGGRECSACPIGYSSSTPGSALCNKCDIGSYTNQTGSATCTLCPEGKSISSVGATACEDCLPGTFAFVEGLQQCSPCNEGTFASTKGHIVCDNCPAGKYTNTKTQIECIDCDVGHYSVAGQTICSACSEGTADNRTGVGDTCSACVPGRYAEGRGQTSCDLCASGKYSGTAGAVGCNDCPTRSVANTTGLGVCAVCGSGSAPNTNRTACECLGVTAGDSSSLGTYLAAYATDASGCSTCPTGGNCLSAGATAGALIAKTGYYRATDSPYDPVFYACLSDSACIDGACATGYRGALCGVCQEGYGRSGRFDCKKCPDAALNRLYLALGIIAMILVIAMLTRMTLISTANNSPRTNSILLKILLSAVQLNSLAARFDFKWPSVVQGWLNAQDFVGSASSSFLSVDCFLTDAGQSPFYTKAIVYLFLPLILITAALIFWISWTYHKSRQLVSQPGGGSRSTLWRSMWIEYASTCVVILFLLHPDLTLQGFNIFACKKVGVSDDSYYLLSDLSRQCYTGNHFKWIFLVAVPMLAIWVSFVSLLALNGFTHLIFAFVVLFG
jgi:hypothetical protein